MTFLDAPRFGSGICFARLNSLLTQLGIDPEWLSATGIAITGSNGKGSASAICSALATTHGFRTGLFTSPHLYRIEERIKVDGVDISADELRETGERIRALSQRISECAPQQRFGAFELLFACAVDIFFRRGCNACVYEAGIGGRYDPVRLVGSLHAAVTSLDLEHTALLGDSLELICFDKVDICRSGGTVVFGENCLPLARSIEAYCDLRDINRIQLGETYRVSHCELSEGVTTFELAFPYSGSSRFAVPLLGKHQASNCSVALILFQEWLLSRSGSGLHLSAAQQALDSVRWPGRLETIRHTPHTVIDVGHTPDGIRSALDALGASFPDERFILVAGVSIDKDADAILQLLLPHFPVVVCTQAFYKGRPAREIAEIARRYRPDVEIHCEPDIRDAERLASGIATREHCGIYVAGGMYLAVEIAQALRGDDPRSLPHI